MSARNQHRVLCSLLALLVVGLIFDSAQAQDPAARHIEELAAMPSGSGVIAAINDEGAPQQSRVVFISPATGKMVWQLVQPFTIGSVAVSPDEKTVAVGLVAVSDRDLGVLFLDARSGKQAGGIGDDPNSYFVPGLVYPRFGSGVSQLRYSPDGALLYGLSNDTLFAWDVAAQRYLWTRDVPAVIEAPKDLPDPLPYGHATDFALSPDGRQIAALRDALRIATAGRMKPRHFIERAATGNAEIETATFSADSRILAAGEFGSKDNGKTTFHHTELWIGGALKALHIDGCGDGIAWTGTPDVFGCQNDTGAHLRNIHDPQKDIGAAGPAGALPILKVGNALWSSSYKRSDWKDPAKPLTITLGELGTGHQITLALPGR